MNQNHTRICVVPAGPHHLLESLLSFPSLLAERLGSRVIDFSNYLTRGGRDSYEFGKDSLGNSHLSVFFYDSSPDIICLLAIQLEALGRPTVVFAPQGSIIDPIVFRMIKAHEDICLFEHFGSGDRLQHDCLPVVERALHRFGEKVELIKRAESSRNGVRVARPA